jgi:hypothetical protein
MLVRFRCIKRPCQPKGTTNELGLLWVTKETLPEELVIAAASSGFSVRAAARECSWLATGMCAASLPLFRNDPSGPRLISEQTAHRPMLAYSVEIDELGPAKDRQSGIRLTNGVLSH